MDSALLCSEKMVKNYNAKYFPLLGKDDTLALKVVRDNHRETNFFDEIHLSVRVSLRNLKRGRLGVLFPEGQSYLHLTSNSCPTCLEQNEWAYQQELGKVYVKVNQIQHPFQSLSIDPLGHIKVRAFSKSRKVVNTCLDTGTVFFS